MIYLVAFILMFIEFWISHHIHNEGLKNNKNDNRQR